MNEFGIDLVIDRGKQIRPNAITMKSCHVTMSIGFVLGCLLDASNNIENNIETT